MLVAFFTNKNLPADLLGFSMTIAGISGLIWLLAGCTTLGP